MRSQENEGQRHISETRDASDERGSEREMPREGVALGNWQWDSLQNEIMLVISAQLIIAGEL